MKTKMNIPGFSADNSFLKRGRFYLLVNKPNTLLKSNGVVPEAVNLKCHENCGVLENVDDRMMCYNFCDNAIGFGGGDGGDGGRNGGGGGSSVEHNPDGSTMCGACHLQGCGCHVEYYSCGPWGKFTCTKQTCVDCDPSKSIFSGWFDNLNKHKPN